jgi:tripartite-type tricarboxylate transporter receptor subunit TctC
MSTRAILASAAALAAIATPAFAQQSVADFYRGKSIDFIIGTEMGSSYDSFARLLARHMPAHIPGNPSFVVRAMPGAGHIKAANWIAQSAPKDGSAIAMVSQLVATSSILKNKPGLEADFTKLRWIGSTDSARQVCVARPDAKVKKGADLYVEKLIVGGTGAGSGVTAIPTFLRDVLGMKFEIVMGYKNSGDVVLAMERGEVEGVCQTYQGVEHSRPGQMASGKINLLFNLEKEPIPGTSAPTVRQFVKTPEQRLMAEFFSANNDLGRPIVAPGEIPADRLEALRNAFNIVVAGPEYQAEAKRQNLDTNFRRGVDQEADLKAISQAPAEIMTLARKYM